MPISLARRSLLAAVSAMALLMPLPSLAESAGAYLASRAAASNNDYAAAAQYFAQALVADPTNAYLQETTVLMDIAQGEFPRALGLAQQIGTAKDGSQIAALLLLAEDARTGAWDKALERLEKGANIGPMIEGLVKAWALEGAGRASDAQEVFDTLAEDKSFAPFALHQKALALALVGDFEGAEEIFASDIGKSFASTRRGLLARIEILSQLERNDDALAEIARLYPREPDPALQALAEKLKAGETLPFTAIETPADGLADTFSMLAGVLSADETEVFGLVYARLTEYLRPDHVETLLLTASVLEKQGQFELADGVYARVPADHPSNLAAQLGRADALARAEKRDEARAVLDELLKKHPEEPLIWSALGDLARAEEKFAEAAKAYGKLIDLAEKQGGAGWVAYYARGICRERSGDWEGAEKDFRQALTLEKDQPAVLNYLGYSYIDKGENLEEALGMIEKAVAAQPDDGAFLDSLGWGLYRLGRYQEAVKYMEQSVELMSDDSLVNDHLGDVYWAAGRKREAEFQWKRALSFGPATEKEAARIRAKLEKGLDAVLAEEGSKPLAELEKKAEND